MNEYAWAIAGAIVGFIGCWGLDLAFFRKGAETAPEDATEWRSRLEAANAEAARYRAQVEAMESLRNERDAARQELAAVRDGSRAAQLEAELAELQRHVRTQRENPAAEAVSQPAPVAVAEEPAPTSELARIVGFGTERRAQLEAAGITTLSQVANLTPEQLLDIFHLDPSNRELAEAWIAEAQEAGGH